MIDGARAFDDGGETPYRSKKDRKKWCRGKVGVEHQPVIRLSRFALAQEERLRSSGRPTRTCEWRVYAVRGELRPERMRVSFSCRHERGCSVCGKVLEWVLAVKDCPEAHEPPGDEVATWPCHCEHPMGEHEAALVGGCLLCKCQSFYFRDPLA